MQGLVEGAPKLADYLNDEARAHFQELQTLLTAANVVFQVNPRLVRGFDYYNRTVFEWVTTKLGAQGTVAGGGRYDGLIEQLGGKPAPACGFAFGTERLVLLLREQQAAGRPRTPDVYLVHAGAGAAATAMQTAEILRDEGLAVHMHMGGGSFKAQMKKADASGAHFAIIIGEDEVATRQVSVKPLRVAVATQLRLSAADAARHILGSRLPATPQHNK